MIAPFLNMTPDQTEMFQNLETKLNKQEVRNSRDQLDALGSDTMNHEALLTAVREQLGLELVPATRPVKMAIIEQSKIALTKASLNQD